MLVLWKLWSPLIPRQAQTTEETAPHTNSTPRNHLWQRTGRLLSRSTLTAGLSPLVSCDVMLNVSCPFAWYVNLSVTWHASFSGARPCQLTGKSDMGIRHCPWMCQIMHKMSPIWNCLVGEWCGFSILPAVPLNSRISYCKCGNGCPSIMRFWCYLSSKRCKTMMPNYAVIALWRLSRFKVRLYSLCLSLTGPMSAVEICRISALLGMCLDTNIKIPRALKVPYCLL